MYFVLNNLVVQSALKALGLCYYKTLGLFIFLTEQFKINCSVVEIDLFELLTVIHHFTVCCSLNKLFF